MCHTEQVRPHLATLVADIRHHGLQLAVVTHRGNRRHACNYHDLAELSARCARAFDQAGLQPGDRVLLWGNNCAEWVAAFFGCILRGIVAVPLDAAGSRDFAQRVIAEVSPRLLIGDLALLQTLELSPATPVWGFSTLAASLPAPDYSPLPGLSRDTPLQIIFTSGTTAEPKGIVHTHGNVLASLDPLEKEIGKYLRYERLIHPLRILHTLPLSHVFGQFMGLWVPSLLVAEVHFEERLQAPRLARLIHDERISVLAAVPRVLDLLRAWVLAEFPGLGAAVDAARGEPIARRWWRFRALHRRLGLKFWAFVSGGASLPPDLESFWTTAGFALVQGYGMTETTALVTLNHPFKIARGSIGKPLAGREVRIGADGEILVRGASIADQVWRNGGLAARDAHEEAGWLATGDLASRNAAGDLVFAGRKSDVIVSAAGMNIHPQDLEAVLRQQSGLRASLVVAFDAPTGPAPAAILIPQTAAASDASLQSAVDAANSELAPFQQMRYWLRWPQAEFPRTATGKILRRTVQSWAQQSLAAGESVAVPSDPLLEVLQQLGAKGPIALDERLVEDLHLDSLAMVQLQSTLETRFGLELADAVWGSVRTVSDVRRLLELDQPAGAPAATVPALPLSPIPESRATATVRPAAQRAPVFPQWPAWQPVRLVRNIFLEAVMRPLIWLLLGPRIAPRAPLRRPSLLVANHLTVLDVPLILYAMSSNDREHTAVAMSGELLTGWRGGTAQRHRMLAALTPLAYGLVTALFHVFPLPRRAGLRESFAYAGHAMDRGHHVLIFPEGRRSPDGRLQPFEAGIGLLAQESEVPVQPIAITGLGGHGGRKWPRRGTVTVRIGELLRMQTGEDPQAFARRLEAAVAALMY